jgi:hypothetical protein
MIHELKILPNFFADVISGKKTFEIRKFDRPFHKGDMLALNEYDAERKCYTGNSCLVYIDYILDDKEYCKQGYVVMAIKPCYTMKADRPYNPNKLCADYGVPYATTESEVEGE